MSTPNLPVDSRRFALRSVPRDFTICDLALALSHLARWGGQAGPLPYTVSQHSCCVSAEVMRQTGNPLAACYAHIHEAHEPVTGEITSTTKVELCRLAGRNVMGLIENAIDAEVYPSLGLDWPCPAEFADVIKDVDQRAAATENRDLDIRHVAIEITALPLPTPIGAVWTWSKATDNFIKAWDRYATMAGVPLAGRRTF